MTTMPRNWRNSVLALLEQGSATVHISKTVDSDSDALCGAPGYLPVLRDFDKIDCDACLVEYAAMRLRVDNTP